MKNYPKHLGLIALLVGSGITGLVACGSDDDDTTPGVDAGLDSSTDGTVGDSATTADSSDSGEVLTDGQIYQYLHEANLGEVAEAKIAETMAQNPAVQSLATMFDQMHSMADTQLTAAATADGITAAESDLSRALENGATTDEQEYQALNGAAFDPVYVMNQLNTHQSVLNTINTVLLPQVRDAGLKTQVQAAQTMVAMHLQELQALEADGGLDGGNEQDSGLHKPDGGDIDASDAGNTADAADAADGE
jgi:putative membrane protein